MVWSSQISLIENGLEPGLGVVLLPVLGSCSITQLPKARRAQTGKRVTIQMLMPHSASTIHKACVISAIRMF